MQKPRQALRKILFTMGLFLCICNAFASDYVADRGWLEDATGQMTLDDAKKHPEQSLTSNLFGSGSSQSTFWIRLRIDPARVPSSNQDGKLVIRIRPVYHDTIWLYDPLSPQYSERVTGDYFDWAKDEWQSLNLNFVIPVGTSPRDVWLKLRTHQVLYTSIDVLTEREALAADRIQVAWSLFYLTVLAFIFGWGVLAWVSQRDPIIGWFNIRIFFCLAYIFFLTGYGRIFLSGSVPEPMVDRLFNISLWAFTAAAIWFDSKLLEEFQANRWLIRAIRLLVIGLPVQLLAMCLGHIHLGVQLNFVMTLLAVVLVFSAAISTRAWHQPKENGVHSKPIIPKFVFVGLYSVAILVVLHNRLAVLRIITPPDNLLDYILLYPLPISIFMMLLLQLRAFRLNQQRQAMQHALGIARREAEIEKKQRIEKERFLSMLTHELKTPISVAKINLGMSGIQGKERDRIDRSLKNMTDVVERCRISAAMEDKRLDLEPETFSTTTVIEELLSFLDNPTRVNFFAAEKCLVHTDRHLFGIVISNLLDNALKYSPPESPISISCNDRMASGINGLSVTVSNQVLPGGLPDHTRMFTKYYRSQTAESKSGSGLGLYISLGLAQMLGGFLRYQTTDDEMEFEFWIPT